VEAFVIVIDGILHADDGWLVYPDGTRLRAISGGKGGGGGSTTIVEAPKPTPQEIAIQEENLKLLRQQVTIAEKQMKALEGFDQAETVALMREQVALARQEAERARARGPAEQAVALRTLQVAEQQLDLTARGMKLQDALQPFVLQSMRLVEEPGGAIRRMTEAEYVGTLSPQEKSAYDNTTLALERERKALAGELPLSAAGRQRKRDEFAAFREQMARGGNPIEGDVPESATSSTTAGVQALKAFNERWGLVEEAERRGELTSGSQSVLARIGVASDVGARQREGFLSAVPRYGIPNYQGTTVEAPRFGLVTPDFAGALQPYQRQREMEFQARLGTAQLRSAAASRSSSNAGAIGAGIGALAGLALAPLTKGASLAIGPLTGAMIGGTVGGAAGTYIGSDPATKKDIRRASRREDQRALAMVKDLDGFTFRYKGESDSAPRRMGMMATRVPRELASPDGRAIDVGRLAGVLTAATRELARRKG
jgi:hypothetical protein